MCTETKNIANYDVKSGIHTVCFLKMYFMKNI